MADNSKLELVVEVDVNKANASIKSINTGLSSMEQAAGKAARGASAGIDGMTASMVKGATAGNLLADSIRKALDWAKEWTIGATEHAAHTDKMSLSMAALAKAHGVSAEASNRAVEAVKKVGFGTQDAIHAVDRLMVADMNLSKAQGLAKVAKDAAAIENISPGEALEKLMLAIESGASRGLRAMGIFVDLNKEVVRQEKLTGKTLDENEVLQLRYNAVMREAAKIQGAAAAATGSAEEHSAALAREVNELKDAVGEQFQGYLRSWVGHLRDLVGFLKDNSDWLVKFGEAAIFVAGAIVTYGIITKIAGITSAVQGLALALAANPWALLLTGVLAGGAIIYSEYQNMHQGMDRNFEDMRRKGLQKDLFSGKLKPDDVKKMGYTDDQVREIATGKKLLPGESWGDLSGLGFPKLKILGKGELSDDAVERIATERKKRGEAEKSAQELYMRAIEERKSAEHDQARARIDDSIKIIESTHSETQAARESLNVVLLSMEEHNAGMAKIREEEKREIEQRSTYTDEKSGAVRHFNLNASTVETIHKATAQKLAAFEMRFNEEESRRIEAMWKAMGARMQKAFEQFVLEPMKQSLYIWEQQSGWQDKIDDQGRSAAMAAVDQRKNLQLAQLDTVTARTLQDKVALENAKTAIEIHAMKERTQIELEEIDVRTERQVDEARKAAMAQGIFDEARLGQISSKIQELGQHEKDSLQKSTTADIDVAQLKGATATRKLVTDQYQSIFQSLKQEAGGVFDALVTKSQSVWSAIGNSLKTATLTAIKDVVTSRVAAMLMNLFVPGAHVEMQHGGSGGGLFGGLLGIGAVPVFGGGRRGIGDVQPVNGAVPVVVMGAVAAGGGYSPAASTFTRLTSMGLSSALAGAMAMGGTLPPRVSGGEVIGGGDSTTGLTQLASGLWQRGPGAGSPMSDLGSIAGIGGTGGFAGGYGGPGGGGGVRGNPLSGIVGNLKAIKWGGLTRAPERWTMGEDGSLTRGTVDANGNVHNGGQITGVNGTAGAALSAGGMMLAQRGLMGPDRGTWQGVGEGAAGGAMIGFQQGGPLGAVIGGVVGFAIGIGEKIAGVETPEREAARLIKSIYGINIDSSSSTIKQVVAMAKQNYGGTISVAVRSPQVRELLQLYADSTGQKSQLLTALQVHPASLTESGGTLYQSAMYRNGTPYTYGSPLPTLGPSGNTIPTASPMGGSVTVMVSPAATQDLWRTGTAQAISGDPRGVALASVNGARQSSARLSSATTYLSPSVVLS